MPEECPKYSEHLSANSTAYFGRAVPNGRPAVDILRESSKVADLLKLVSGVYDYILRASDVFIQPSRLGCAMG